VSVITPPWTSAGDLDRGEHIGVDAWDLCAEFVDRLVSDARATASRSTSEEMVPAVDWDRIWRAAEGAPSDEAAIGRVVSEAWLVAQEFAAGTMAPHMGTPDATNLEVPAEPGLDPGVLAGQEAPPQQGHVAAPAGVAAAATSLAAPESVAPPEAPVADRADSVAAFEEPVRVVEPAVPVEEPVTVVEPGVPVEEPLTVLEPAVSVEEPATASVGPAVVHESPLTGTAPEAVSTETPPTAPPVVAASAAGSVTLDRPDRGPVTVAEPAEQLLPSPQVAVGQTRQTEAGRRSVRHHSGWFRFFTWLEVIGAIMILFVVWQLWGTSIAQGRAQDQLKAQFDALRAHHHPPKATAAGPSLIAAGVRLPAPPDGSVVAELQIPAIGVDQYVVEGTTTDDLSKGPGHYTGTAAPGQAGNVAIAGHRTTHGAPFNRLGDLRKGDRIILTTTSGETFTYAVAGTPAAVSPGDVSVLNYFGDNRITLTTCNPEFSSTQRLIAVGELKGPDAKPVYLPKHVAYHVSNTGTNSWEWSLLPVVGIEVCLLVLLGMTYRRFDFWFGRVGQWIILVPLWAAGLFLLFDTLTNFLPASV
jgi:LPXTG-site transpeptidase (sortase) family protein